MPSVLCLPLFPLRQHCCVYWAAGRGKEIPRCYLPAMGGGVLTQWWGFMQGAALGLATPRHCVYLISRLEMDTVLEGLALSLRVLQATAVIAWRLLQEG